MVFTKLVRSRFRRDKEEGRRLERPADLLAGDLVSFKHRLALPKDVQGRTFEVASVATYQYESGIEVQFSLVGEEGTKFYLGLDPKESQPELCLSRDLKRKDVLKLFDEDAFAGLWDEEEFAELDVAEPLERYAGWLADGYSQVTKDAVGFYYDRDCRGETLSMRQDDDSEELRYHECEGSNDSFGLNVEIWGDGETDVSLEVYCGSDVIESMWPGDG
ncbi:MAG: hypothetical protein OXQ90_12600 [Gammaproteobacteria bacterium]|nr:hypothetical protein [Gammaproteobacteria bacterium]